MKYELILHNEAKRLTGYSSSNDFIKYFNDYFSSLNEMYLKIDEESFEKSITSILGGKLKLQEYLRELAGSGSYSIIDKYYLLFVVSGYYSIHCGKNDVRHRDFCDACDATDIDRCEHIYNILYYIINRMDKHEFLTNEFKTLVKSNNMFDIANKGVRVQVLYLLYYISITYSKSVFSGINTLGIQKRVYGLLTEDLVRDDIICMSNGNQSIYNHLSKFLDSTDCEKVSSNLDKVLMNMYYSHYIDKGRVCFSTERYYKSIGYLNDNQLYKISTLDSDKDLVEYICYILNHVPDPITFIEKELNLSISNGSIYNKEFTKYMNELTSNSIKFTEKDIQHISDCIYNGKSITDILIKYGCIEYDHKYLEECVKSSLMVLVSLYDLGYNIKELTSGFIYRVSYFIKNEVCMELNPVVCCIVYLSLMSDYTRFCCYVDDCGIRNDTEINYISSCIYSAVNIV